MVFPLESTLPGHVNTPTPSKSEREGERKIPGSHLCESGDFKFEAGIKFLCFK